MGFGHDVPFLNYSDTLPHPSDFMSAWSGQVRVAIQLISWNLLYYSQLRRLTGSNLLTFFLTYLLTFFLTNLLIYLLTIFLTYLLTFFLTYLLTFLLTNLLTLFLTYLLTFFLTFVLSFDILSDISSDSLSNISKPKPNIHNFTKKAALQTLYLPRTTQQK